MKPYEMTLHFFIFNLSNHFSIHNCRFSKSFCYKFASLLHVICRNNLASSAYKNNSDALLQLSTKSLMKNINNERPKIELCGIPLRTLFAFQQQQIVICNYDVY